ncbi:Kiwa anti-phage protein KwaB-like domain-containing protein [Synechococcus elongatus IITB7]|uniref:Kiwa anti-phage protein KwaB-like domain-containing protein n=1 Tax=Synechococcus elongatus TaxID=32046 RepID=UPI0030CE761C
MTLIACLRNQNDDQYRVMPIAPNIVDDVKSVMMSGKNALFGDDLEVIDYEPGYTLEDGQVFRLRDEEIANQISDNFQRTSCLDRLEGGDINKLSICGVFGQGTIDDLTVIVGQVLTSACVLQNASGLSLLWHDQDNYTRLIGEGLTLRRATDILIINDEIRFLNYSTATRLLDLSRHFEEATDNMLFQFVQSSQLMVDDFEAFKNNADTWIRRKIAIIMGRKILDRVTIETIKDSAVRAQLEIDLCDTGERITIPAEKSRIKQLLRFLDEDLFSGALTGDSFITNSKRMRR